MLIVVGFVGRNVEVVGVVFLRSVVGIFSYFKIKGLFVGVFFEGLVIIECKDVNVKFYG